MSLRDQYTLDETHVSDLPQPDDNIRVPKEPDRKIPNNKPIYYKSNEALVFNIEIAVTFENIMRFVNFLLLIWIIIKLPNSG